MTDENENLRAAHAAEQAEAKSQLSKETEFNDWFRDWKREDLMADLTLNQTRATQNATITAYWMHKSEFWSNVSSLVHLINLIILVVAVGMGVDFIIGLF